MTRSDIVNMPIRRFSVEEYYRLAEVGILGPEDKVELINGEIVKMSPIGPRHAGVVITINKLLPTLLGEQYLLSPQNPVRLSSYSEPEPDIVILHAREDNYTKSHPQAKDVALLIEVSNSTLEYDTKVKLPLYAEQGISQYWVIDLQEDRILTYSDPTAHTSYQIEHVYRRGDTISNPLFSREILVEELILG